MTRWWDPVAATWHNEVGRVATDVFAAAHPFPDRDGVLLVTREPAG